MSTKTVSPDMSPPSTADERWATWVARGVANDRKSRRGTLAIAVAVGVGLAAWLVRLLVLG